MPIKETLAFPPERNELWELARQMGVEVAVSRLPNRGAWRGTAVAEETDETRPWEFEPLMHMQQRYENAGLELVGIEDIYPVLEEIRLGTDRDRGITVMWELIESLGALDVSLLVYTWSSPRFNWVRTSTTTPLRGESLTAAYDHELMSGAPTVDVAVTTEELWENFEYFLERIVPVAESAGVKLALHPDDPPVSSVRGVPRILTSPDAVERALELVDSDHHGLTFCQGTFGAMGVDLSSAIHRFADRVHYVHFRDVDVSGDSFVETWHDNGPSDMAELIDIWDSVGFDGPMRPDHVPTMAGEANDNPGYETKGRLFAIGYMRGLLEALDAS